MKNKLNYIILDIGKLVIVNEKNSKKFFIEDNGTLRDLTEKEKEYVKNIYNKEGSYIYNTEKLESVVHSNDKLDKKEYVLPLLNCIEQLIPDGYRDNFYKNLETLHIEYEVDDLLNNNLDNNILQENETSSLVNYSYYDVRNNVVRMNKQTTKEFWDIACNYGELKNELFNKIYNESILHELVHMASSNYNHDTEVSLVGFDKYPASLEEDKNRGLTEGFTELLAFLLIPTGIEHTCSYYQQAILVNQLLEIVGTEVMLTSFFGNKGTKEIEKELNKIIDSSKLSNDFFRSFEDNYILRNYDAEQTFLANTQLTLIDYFIAKTRKRIKEGSISSEELTKVVQGFEKRLITPEILKKMHKDPNNYIGLLETLEYYKTFMETILEDNQQLSINGYKNNYK